MVGETFSITLICPIRGRLEGYPYRLDMRTTRSRFDEPVMKLSWLHDLNESNRGKTDQVD